MHVVIVLMGIVGGCIALRLLCFGIFLLGAAVGCAIGFTAYAGIFSQVHWPSAVPKLVLAFAPYISMVSDYFLRTHGVNYAIAAHLSWRACPHAYNSRLRLEFYSAF